MATFLTIRPLPRQPAPPKDRDAHVHLVEFPVALRPLWHKVGIVEAFVGDEVVVRFGDVRI